MTSRHDVLVIGGGSAGSAVARATARAGLATLLVEKGRFDDAGAAWVNGVNARHFDEGGLAPPTPPELRATRPLVSLDGLPMTHAHRFHLVAGWGPERLSFARTGLLEVDMRHLNARLRREAAMAGALLKEDTRVLAIDPARGLAMTSRGDEHAAVIVDATGLGGFFKKEKPRPADICAAAQGVYAVTDRAAAYAWCDSQDATPGDTVCFTSVAGGYSIVSSRLEEGEDGPELSVLTGSLPALGHASGVALRNAFVASLPWVGPMRFGGQAPIPLHAPRRRLAFVNGLHAIVRVGDAAGQVYAAHGSGIGAQLVAARMLADALSAEGVAGAKTFERRWHRRFYREFLAADLFRRASSRLSPRFLALAFRTGLFPPALVERGFGAGLA